MQQMQIYRSLKAALQVLWQDRKLLNSRFALFSAASLTDIFVTQLQIIQSERPIM